MSFPAFTCALSTTTSCFDDVIVTFPTASTFDCFSCPAKVAFLEACINTSPPSFLASAPAAFSVVIVESPIMTLFKEVNQIFPSLPFTALTACSV